MSESGASIVEVLVAFSMVSIILATAVSNLRVADDPLINATNQVASHIKTVRAKAISTTSAYHLEALTPTLIQAKVANTCAEAADGAVDAPMSLQLPKGTSMTFPNGDLAICFSPRGMPNDALVFIVQDDSGRVREIEILLGGAVRVQ